MSRVTVSPNKDGLLQAGKPWFYLADTVWSVFSNASIEEWAQYLDYRRMQNFNALQISMLPILHDASNTYVGLAPFHLGDNGKWNFSHINDEFFDKAETMVAMACDKGFVPVLVVLWNNYVPGTWANKKASDSTMPKDAVKPYTEYVARRFSKYNPMYFISGDSKFETAEIIEYFDISLRALKEIEPHALTAMHPTSNFHQLDDKFIQSSDLDLYIYQSGHHLQEQHMTYGLAEAFSEKSVKRPIINSEPCYEGHGHGNQYGRFDEFDLRRAFWSSVLSGAKAGFTYGAHGIWSWHKKGAEFNNEGFSKIPFDWSASLTLRGAWDVGYSKWIFEQYKLFDLNPRQDLIDSPYPDIRTAASEDLNTIVIYTPYANDVQLHIELSEYQVVMINLQDRHIIIPELSYDENGTKVAMTQMNVDTLLIATRL